jgi:hypothetical protein
VHRLYIACLIWVLCLIGFAYVLFGESSVLHAYLAGSVVAVTLDWILIEPTRKSFHRFVLSTTLLCVLIVSFSHSGLKQKIFFALDAIAVNAALWIVSIKRKRS